MRGSERGVALAMALVAAMLVSITAAVVLNVAGHRWQRTRVIQRRGDRFYAAEAGVQVALLKLVRTPRLPPFQGNPSTWPQDDPRRPGMPSMVDSTVTVIRRPVTVRVTRIATAPDRFEVRSSITD